MLFLEQPFEPDDMNGLAALARATPIAIGADEGIHSLHDIEAHAAAGARRRLAQAHQARRLRRRRSPRPRCAGASGSRSTSRQDGGVIARVGGDRASRLCRRQHRLGRQPHPFLSRRGHRAPASGDGRTVWWRCRSAPGSASTSTRRQWRGCAPIEIFLIDFVSAAQRTPYDGIPVLLAARQARGGPDQPAARKLGRRKIAELFHPHHAAAWRCRRSRGRAVVDLRRQGRHLAARPHPRPLSLAGIGVLQCPLGRALSRRHQADRQVRPPGRGSRLFAGPVPVGDDARGAEGDHRQEPRRTGQCRRRTSAGLGDVGLRLERAHHRFSGPGRHRLLRRRDGLEHAAPREDRERRDRRAAVVGVRRQPRAAGEPARFLRRLQGHLRISLRPRAGRHPASRHPRPLRRAAAGDCAALEAAALFHRVHRRLVPDPSGAREVFPRQQASRPCRFRGGSSDGECEFGRRRRPR